jgi:dipeptidyl aminopeptidase/acylaminoacyl peptidase
MYKKIIASLIVSVLCISAYAQNRMTPELLWDLKRVGNIQVSPDNSTILFSIKEYDLNKNEGENNLYTITVDGGEIKQITNFKGGKHDAQWRPDGQKIAFMKVNDEVMNIYEMNIDGTAIKQISKFKTSIGGFKYSNDMSKVLFIRDVKLKNFHSTELEKDLTKSNAKVYDNLMYRHWSSYANGTYSHVFFAVIQNGRVEGQGVDIMPNETFDAPLKPFGGMEQINFSPDGNQIVYTSKKLNGKDYAFSTNSELYIYDINKIKTTCLTKNGYEGYDNEAVYSKNGNRIAWLSMATNGFESDKNNIIIYDFKTEKYVNITEGIDLTISSMVWDNTGEKIYFKAAIEATYQLFEISRKSGKYTQLTQGMHNYTSLAFADDRLIAGKQSMNHPTDIYSVLIDEKESTQLTDVNKAVYDKLDIGKIEKRWVKTTDGKKELVWVIYPPNFDENKKYPALLYCQGGPQSAVSQFFSYRWNFQLMAANDYIIFAPNRRGLPSFGQQWNDVISGDWGGQAIDDYISAVDDLKKEKYIDETKIGAVGASYGGYSVYYLAGMHENRFATFISHCGLFNLDSWYGTTEELFFANHDIGIPPTYKKKENSGISSTDQTNDNKKYDYKQNSPHQFVKNWNTPMLIFQGEKDYRVPMGQGLEAFQALQVNEIESRLVLFPDENHWIQSPQNGVFWHRQYYDWLDKYLK